MSRNLRCEICNRCRLPLKFGVDGVCPDCGTALCWDCWQEHKTRCASQLERLPEPPKEKPRCPTTD